MNIVFKEKPNYSRFKDLEGLRFGKVVVLGYAVLTKIILFDIIRKNRKSIQTLIN